MAAATAWWSPAGRALHCCERLSKFDRYFAVKSPFARERIDGYRLLKGRTALEVTEPIPAAAMPFVREGLFDAFIVGKPVGQTLVPRALMAEEARIPLWVGHSIASGVDQAFHPHQAAAFPGIVYALSVGHVAEDGLMLEPLGMNDGFYEVPREPGLGVLPDMDAIENYRVARNPAQLN